MELQQILRKVATVLAVDLGEAATVSMVGPTPSFRTAVIVIRPTLEGAAPVSVWAEDDCLAASAGDHAQFLMEGESEEQLIAMVRSLVQDVAQGRLYDRYLGTRYITSVLQSAPSAKFGRFVRWLPYSAPSSGS